jgi:hypothetical protein
MLAHQIILALKLLVPVGMIRASQGLASACGWTPGRDEKKRKAVIQFIGKPHENH